MSNDNIPAVRNAAIEGVVGRLSCSPPNNLSDESYRGMVRASWDGQWGNWDDLGGDDPGWGDVKG
jgi:hypothetical protein